MAQGSKHVVLGGLVAAMALLWLMSLEGLAFVSGAPWGLLSGGLLLYWLGMLTAELLDRRSTLRRALVALRRVYEIEHVARIHQVDEHKEWIEPTAILRFCQPLKEAEITLTVSTLEEPASAAFVLDHRVLPAVEAGHRETLALAVVPLTRQDGKPAGHTAWGSRYRESGDTTSLRRLDSGRDYLVRVAVSARGHGTQQESIVLHLSDAARADSHLFVLKDGDRGLEIVRE